MRHEPLLVFAGLAAACSGQLKGNNTVFVPYDYDAASDTIAIPACHWNGFASQVTYATATNPTVLVAGDFNLDGHADIAVANGAGQKSVVGLFVNTGDGTFAPQVTTIAQSAPVSMAVAADPFNAQDAYPGIFYAPPGGGGGTYSVMENQKGVLQQPATSVGLTNNTPAGYLAIGSFFGSMGIAYTTDGLVVDQQSFPTDKGPGVLATGDFNGDGFTDIAVGTQTVPRLDIFIASSGSFAASASYQAGNYPSAMTVADFNGDGHADIAALHFKDSTMGVFLNIGDGTFAAQVTYEASYEPASIASGDFNGDGYIDLAFPDSLGNVVVVYLNNGDGSFANPMAYGVGKTPRYVIASDVNGDGHLDLAVTNSADNTLGILLSICE